MEGAKDTDDRGAPAPRREIAPTERLVTGDPECDRKESALPDVEVDRLRTLSKGQPQDRGTVGATGISVDPAATHQPGSNPPADETRTSGEQEARLIYWTDTASPADLMHAVSEVVELLAVVEQNEGTRDVTMPGGAVQALDADRTDSLVTDVLRCTHDAEPEQLTQGRGRGKSLPGRATERRRLHAHAQRGDEDRQRDCGQQPSEADERSHGPNSALSRLRFRRLNDPLTQA
jgi:hypothetical protein